jgi:hypothetical protein
MKARRPCSLPSWKEAVWAESAAAMPQIRNAPKNLEVRTTMIIQADPAGSPMARDFCHIPYRNGHSYFMKK